MDCECRNRGRAVSPLGPYLGITLLISLLSRRHYLVSSSITQQMSARSAFAPAQLWCDLQVWFPRQETERGRIITRVEEERATIVILVSGKCSLVEAGSAPNAYVQHSSNITFRRCSVGCAGAERCLSLWVFSPGTRVSGTARLILIEVETFCQSCGFGDTARIRTTLYCVTLGLLRSSVRN